MQQTYLNPQNFGHGPYALGLGQKKILQAYTPNGTTL